MVTLPLFLVAGVANAQGLAGGDTGNFGDFAAGLIDVINNYLIPFLVALAVLAFVYGIFLYFIAGSDDDEKRAKGRNVLLYAIIGFVAIVALWGIVSFVEEAFGFGTEGPPPTPTGPTV